MTRRLSRKLLAPLALILVASCSDTSKDTDPPDAENWPTGLTSPIQGATFPLSQDHLPGASDRHGTILDKGFEFFDGLSGRPLSNNQSVVAIADGEIVRIDREYSTEGAALLAFWEDQATEPGFIGEYAFDRLRGRQVWIRHESGQISRYGHLADVHPELKPGDTVEQGTPIGLMGNSGVAPVDGRTQADSRLYFELWSADGSHHLGKGLSALETHQVIAQLFGPGSLPRYARQIVQRIESGQERPESYPPSEFPDSGFNADPPDEIIAGNPFAFPITWDGDDFEPDDFFATLQGLPLGIIDAGDGIWVLGAMPLQSNVEHLDLVIGAIDSYGQTLVGNRLIGYRAREKRLPPLERDPAMLARYSEENLQIEAEKLNPVHLESLNLRDPQWREPFEPPMQGEIAAVFGQRLFHSVLKPAHPLPGLEIIADQEVSTVRAANSGVVALVDELPIRGKTVALVHGGGVVTIYAYLDETNVSLGTTVSRGQVLGTMRHSQSTSTGALRAEIHVAGQPSDPFEWANRVLPVER